MGELLERVCQLYVSAAVMRHAKSVVMASVIPLATARGFGAVDAPRKPF